MRIQKLANGLTDRVIVYLIKSSCWSYHSK